MRNLRSYIIVLSLIAGICGKAAGQAIPDSVIRQYESAKTGNEKLSLLYDYLNKLRRDPSFLPKAAVLIDFLKSIKDTRNQDIIQLSINDQLSKTGDYATALSSTLEIANRFEQLGDKAGILSAYRQLSTSYYYAGDREKDVIYGKKAFFVAKEMNEDPEILSGITNNISTSYSQNNMADSALKYGRLSLYYAEKSKDAAVYAITGILGTLSEAFISAKQYDSALIYARQGVSKSLSEPDLGKTWTFNDLSQIFLETNQYDSSKYYAQKAAQISAAMGFKDQLQRAYEYLSRSFDKTHASDSALKYLQLAVIIKDSLYSSEKTKQVQGVMAREWLRLQEIEREKADLQTKMKVYFLIAGLLILVIVAFLLYRNNRQKQKANSSLQVQKEKVETTLQELKSTQQQLIQSEKMASLGELTAGIAHEIQNPLNFVNNFSEVNNELIEELKSQKSTLKSEEQDELLDNILSNSQKINHHGKRADAIVKGMLQHSKSSSGKKEPTDVNALCDEYLRLSYHGLRAKDKSFNATIKTDYDETIGKINIIPQDIGRVILNLLTNAFYAASLPSKGGFSDSNTNNTPRVWVGTKKADGKVFIAVRDNGPGIPKEIIDKIFQPFFTTKPTGEGTGLGLSLSYDIVKAHGGEITVDSEEGSGTTFNIQLPI